MDWQVRLWAILLAPVIGRLIGVVILRAEQPLSIAWY
jgi:hypothetical protein